MDKKKVIELIKEAQHLAFLRKCENRRAYLNNCIRCLKEALEELSKSDWISVDERLPEYGEKVYVKSERSPHLIQTHREDFDENDGKFHPFRNKNKFILEKGIYGNITHWKPIEKLEE